MAKLTDADVLRFKASEPVTGAAPSEALIANVAEDKLSRFQRGKPADPTKHMSDEDAAKWKAMNDEHKDNFKSATFKDGKPQCDDDRNCKEPIAFQDSKGYIYCQKHGEKLKKAGRTGVRPLSKAAIKKLEEQAQGEKSASGRTKHLSGKKGYTLCGEDAHKDTIVDSVTDSTCHYCVSAWEKAHGGHR